MPRAIAEIKAILAERRDALHRSSEDNPPNGHHGFDPNQPRVPKGSPHGGEWADARPAQEGSPNDYWIQVADGHHWVPRAFWKRLKPETRKVFDQAKSNSSRNC